QKMGVSLHSLAWKPSSSEVCAPVHPGVLWVGSARWGWGYRCKWPPMRGHRGHWYVLVPQRVLLERRRARMVFCKIVMNGTVASKHIYFCRLRYVADGRR